jgi:predicted MFS family arabinose efflux permease
LGVYFARDFAFGQLTISMLITLTSFSGIFGEAIGGVMSDKFGRTKTIKIGTALMIFSVAALIFKPNLYTLIFIMIAWGLGWTFNHVGLSTILTDLPKKFVNESASLNSGVRFLAGGLGALVGGLLMQKSFTFGLSIFGLMLFGLLFVEDFLLKAKGA